MFRNIGEKIQTFSKICCWLLIILSLIAGIALIISDAVLEGFLTMIIGAFLAWVSAFILYGFGTFVENSCIQTDLMIKWDREKSGN